MNNSNTLALKYNKLTTREKFLVLFTGIAIIFMIGLQLVIEPQYKSWQTTKASIISSQKIVERMRSQLADIENGLAKEPNFELKRQISLLEKEHNDINADLLESELALVSASEMATTLKTLLKENSQLKLVKFSSLPAEAIQVEAQAKNMGEEVSAPLLYRHTISMVVKGRYFSILKFLEDIENNNQQLLWQAIDYQVTEHPSAQATIEVYTLGTEKEFIGVNY